MGASRYRPRLPLDQRTNYATILGAICPEGGKAAGLVMPKRNASAINTHIQEISLAVDAGGHAMLMLESAGWHLAERIVPDSSTLLPLPPSARELHPPAPVEGGERLANLYAGKPSLL